MVFQIKKLGKLLDLGAMSPLGSSVIGIDIGSSALKVIQLSQGKNGAALETYGELMLGPYGGGDVGAPIQLEPQKLSAALVDIMREANVTAKTSALAVPHAASFIAVAPFPTREQAELPSMVPIEARKYVPMAMSEITLDWFVIPDMPTPKDAPPPTSTNVLMAAIHNESLKRYRTVVQNAGVAVVMNEIEPFSVVRSSIHENDSSVLLIDMGASSTKTYIVESGILEETHRIPFGGHQLTQTLGTTMNLPYGEAEMLKRSSGLIETASDALLPGIDRVLADVMRTCERFERQTLRKIERVVLTGGGSLLKGIDERIASVLNREVRHAHPFAKVEHPAFLEEILKEVGPSFAVALGVALRSIARSE